MARQKQDGLKYFSFDTDFFYADKRIKRLHARYGNDGVMFYVYLLTEIYRNGYYARWDEDSIYDAMSLNLTEGFIEQVMLFFNARELIVKIDIGASNGTDTVITSPGIQRRYQEAVKGLKRDVYVDADIWLLKEEETAAYIKVTQNGTISKKNENKSGKNENKSEKNTTKEIILKDINNICAPEPHEQEPDKEEQLRQNFEIIYGLYPKKVGRTVAFAEYKKWVSKKGRDVSGKRYRLTDRQIYYAVKKYVRQQRESGQEDLQYWKNFDTLMGRQLLDYIDFEEGG